MRYKLIKSICTIFILVSCKIEIYNFSYYPDGKLKEKTKIDDKGLASGIHEEYYETGEIKLKTKYTKGELLDSIFKFYKNGVIKEKGLMLDGKKNKWWFAYDLSGRLKQKQEYIIANDSCKLNQSIDYLKDGSINYDKSWFFTIELPDTLKIGKNVGKLRYYSTLKGTDKYLKVVIENQFSDSEKKVEIFSEHPDSTRFGIYAHKTGKKKIIGKIIEKIVTLVDFTKDSSALKIEEYEKTFKKEVIVIE